MTSTTPDQSAGPFADDEFLWLEDIHGHKSLDWVREENHATEELLSGTEFKNTEKRQIGRAHV